MILTAASFLVLFAATVFLFFLAVVEAFTAHGPIWVVLLNALIFAAMLFGAVNEWFGGVLKCRDKPEWRRNDLYDLLRIAGAAALVFVLTAEFGVEPITALALVATVGCILLPGCGASIFCGVFVGMPCGIADATYMQMVLAAGIAFALNRGAKNIFQGIAAKTAAAAFCGCAAATALCGRSLAAEAVAAGGAPQYAVPCVIFGALVVRSLIFRLRQDSVLSLGLAGLAAGVILPAMHRETGAFLAAAVVAGALTAMSDARLLRHELELFAVSLICAAALTYTAPYLGKIPGKVGIIAFGSVIAYGGARLACARGWRMLERVLKKND